MQYRHMHDCPKVSRWVPSLNTNGIDWNAGAPKSLRALKTTPTPKIKMPPRYMATRKGMERVMAALPPPAAVLPMVIFPLNPPLQTFPPMERRFSCQCSTMVPFGTFNAVHRVC